MSLMGGLGCAAIYPEIDTPIGPPPNAESPSPPPPDDYVFLYIKGARLPSQTRDGRKWGKGGDGFPSPYAILFIDGTEINRTAVEENTLEPTWPNQKKANYQMPSKRQLRVEVWDDHGLFPHPICVKEIHNLPSYVDMGEAGNRLRRRRAHHPWCRAGACALGARVLFRAQDIVGLCHPRDCGVVRWTRWIEAGRSDTFNHGPTRITNGERRSSKPDSK